MPPHDHSLQEDLDQHLEVLKAGEDPDGWMRNLMQWLLQETLDMEGG